MIVTTVMTKLYTDKDLYDLGNALCNAQCNYTQKDRYIPNELSYKITFLLNHPEPMELTGKNLLYEFDRFMDKYHPSNPHTYKLVRNICKHSAKIYLFETYGYCEATDKFNMLAKTLPYDIITPSGIVVHISND
jgi:hypothetical protein